MVFWAGVMIDLVRVLHDNMETVFVAGESARIQVSNGLRQRCVCWYQLCSCCSSIWSCSVGEGDVRALK